MLAGQVVRVLTTGGGGWGDPLDREMALVVRDVLEGKVSQQSARDDYGVVLSGEGETLRVDAAATDALRADQRARLGERPIIDRGPGYAMMAGTA